MNRKSKALRGAVITAAAALVLTGLAACGGSDTSSGSSAKEVNLRLDFVHTGKDAIWTYGIEQGFFKDEGIDLKIEDGKGSATTGQTVANGSDTFGLVDGGTMITLASKKVPLTAVAGVFGQSPLVVLSAKKAPITDPAQLKGKKVAVTAGDGPTTLFPALLDANGINKGDVTMVNMQPQAKLTSLLSGRVDAVATLGLVSVALEAKGTPTQMLAYKDHGVVTPGYYLVTSNGNLKSKAALVQGFVKATQKSIAATVKDPDAAVASLVKYYPEAKEAVAKAELAVMLPLIKSPATDGHPVGWMSPEVAEAAGTLLKKYGALQSPAPVDGYLSNKFIK